MYDTDSVFGRDFFFFFSPPYQVEEFARSASNSVNQNSLNEQFYLQKVNCQQSLKYYCFDTDFKAYQDILQSFIDIFLSSLKSRF